MRHTQPQGRAPVSVSYHRSEERLTRNETDFSNSPVDGLPGKGTAWGHGRQSEGHARPPQARSPAGTGSSRRKESHAHLGTQSLSRWCRAPSPRSWASERSRGETARCFTQRPAPDHRLRPREVLTQQRERGGCPRTRLGRRGTRLTWGLWREGVQLKMAVRPPSRQQQTAGRSGLGSGTEVWEQM